MNGADSDLIKKLAMDVGFDLCGITTPEPAEKSARQFRKWLDDGLHGEMSYLARDVDRRTDPAVVMPGVRSLIMLGLNYYESTTAPIPADSGQVSRYAVGRDYHKVAESMIKELIRRLEPEPGDSPAQFRWYVDYGPLLERTYAERAGLGFIGKNGMLINRNHGSYCFLAGILTDLPLEPDVSDPLEHGSCGTCRACIEACPTEAIISPRRIDARRCISYLTIERPDNISEELAVRMSDHIFGCDICQEVCPHNSDLIPTRHTQLTSEAGVGRYLPLERVLNLTTREEFLSLTAGTPLTRPRLEGLQRNARIARRNLQRQGRK